jgi:hypothetical protein
MTRASRLAIVAGAVAALTASHPASAASTVWDLGLQYPFAPFTLVQGSTPLPAVTDWGGYQIGNTYTPQPAYAPGPETSTHPGDYLPAWFKMTASVSGQVRGDMIVHTTDTANGGDNGPASVLFVSPSAGKATISGFVYAAGFATPGRPQAWQVSLNGAVLASGSDPDNGSIDRAHPARFNLARVALQQGDIVALTVIQTGGIGTFMGIDLKVAIAIPAD